MDLAEHADHKWEQHGRCVWCKTCGVRLYQGKLPKPGEQKMHAESLDALLAGARAKIESKVKKDESARLERVPEPALQEK